MDGNKGFGTSLRQLRVGLHMTLDDMAAELDLDRITIHRYEKGTLNPRYEVLAKLVHFAAQKNRQEAASAFLQPFSAILGASIPALERAVFEKAAA